MTPVRLEPAALRSRVKHFTTEPLRSLRFVCELTVHDKLKSEQMACLLFFKYNALFKDWNSYFKLALDDKNH